MTLVLVALVYAVGQRITVKADQQTEDDLRVAVATLLREACLAQVILTVRLKVKRGHVIEHHSDVAAKQIHRVADADVLHRILIFIIQLVEVAVNLRQVNILVKMVLQILHRGRLARRI